MEIQPARSNDRTTWNEFVRLHGGTVYHLYDWKEILQDAYHIHHYCFWIKDKGVRNGLISFSRIPGLMRDSFVSNPFVCYGGPVVTPGASKEELIFAVEKWKGFPQEKETEIREITPLSLPNRFVDSDNRAMVVPLAPTISETFRKIGHTARKHVKKSEKYRFLTKAGEMYLKDFFRVYTLRLKELGTPCHSLGFWQRILTTFPNNANVLTIWHRDKVIAGMFYLIWNGIFSDVLAVCLSDYRQHCAYYFLHWEAMKIAVNQGCRLFDFERSQTNSGTFLFKKQWNSLEVPLYYYHTRKRSISATKAKFARAIQTWQSLPLPLTKLLGPIFRRRIP